MYKLLQNKVLLLPFLKYMIFFEGIHSFSTLKAEAFFASLRLR